MQHFIAEFKNAIPKDFCEKLIAKFEQDNNKTQGKVGSGVDKSKKNSIDLHISTLPTWQAEHQHITQIINQALIQYVRGYPHVLIGAISPSILDATTQKAKAITVEDVPKLSDSQLEMILKGVFDVDAINLQKYIKGQGNFSHWHSEHYPHPTDPQQKSLHRTLLWLVYLNDVNEGGETEFLYQQAQIKPTTGSIIISPCGFTHTHRGVTPISNDKYVLASWINFKPANALYRQA